MTNAQAALQAAATVYSGGRGHTTPASVKLLAESFLNWLDHQDAPNPTTPPAGRFSRGGLIREPTELDPEVKISAAVFFRYHDERCCSRDTGDEKDCCCKTR